MLSFFKKYMFVILICVLSVFMLLVYAYDGYYTNSIREFDKYTNETIREKTSLSLFELYEENIEFYRKNKNYDKGKLPLEIQIELIFYGVNGIYRLTFFFVILFSIFLLVIIIYLAVIANRLKK